MMLQRLLLDSVSYREKYSPERGIESKSNDCLLCGHLDDASRQHLRRELLLALQRHPRLIADRQGSLGDLALDLGKVLVWLAHRLDGPGPQLELSLSETPDTIFALGSQFQTVGRALIQNRPVNEETLKNLSSEVASNKIAIRALEIQLRRLEIKGGAR